MMNLHKKIIWICFAILLSGLAMADEKTDKTYLDMFVISMWDDVRTYVLALKLADNPNSKPLMPIKDALSKKLYDLQIYLPEVDNREVIDLVCEHHNKIKREIFDLSNGCKDDFCMESGRLERMCVVGKKWQSK